MTFSDRQLAYILSESIGFSWVSKDILDGEMPSRQVLRDMLWHAVGAYKISIVFQADLYVARTAIGANREATAISDQADRAVMHLLADVYPVPEYVAQL